MASVAHYRILDRIGSGGLGDIFRARDTRYGRTVALKILPAAIAADPSSRRWFLDGTRDLLTLSHPAIATLYEIGEEQKTGRLFLAYEFVPGETLRAAIAGRPMNPNVAIDVAAGLADALAEAHAHGLVHGELRPENIMVTPTGHAKILDFGMAAWTWGGAGRRRVARGEAGGELARIVAPYMSPEQVLGEPADQRTDLFSLGVVLFEMLTGQAPFRAAAPDDTMLNVLRVSPPSPTALRPGLPPEVDVIVARALHKSLDGRYQGAAAMAAELRQLGAVLDIRGSLHEEIPSVVSRSSRRPWWRFVMILLVFAGLAAAGWMWREDLVRHWWGTFGPLPDPVIVVVPHVADPSRAFLVQGFADELSERLGMMPGVSVLDRSRIQSAESPPVSDAAAAELHVRLAARDDRFEVDVDLRRGREGPLVWAQRFEQSQHQVFGLQDEVAGALIRALGLDVALTPARARAAARTVDPTAYVLYLRGRAAAARGDWPMAIEFYTRATTADDGLPEAHAGLALALYERARATGASSDPVLVRRLRQAAARAVAGDPDLARSQMAAGLAAETLAGAARAFRRAMEIDPSAAAPLVGAGDLVAEVDPGLALLFYERAAVLDAGVPGIDARAALALLRLGRYDGVETRLAKTTGPTRAALQAILDLDRGRYDAVAAMTIGVTEIGPTAALARVIALREAGQGDEAVELAGSIALWYPPFCDIEAIAAALRFDLGQRARALAAVRDVVADAAAVDASPAAAGCAALATIGVQNAPAAATWLHYIAGSEEALRAWVGPADAVGRHTWLGRRWYPWHQAPVEPALEEAVVALDEAVARYRDEAASLLAGALDDH